LTEETKVKDPEAPLYV